MEYDSGKVWQGPLLQQNYSLGVGMTPLFVGGSEIVVERRNGKLCTRIYPVAERAVVAQLRRPNASTDTTIRLVHPLSSRLSVLTSERAEEVQGVWVDHAYQFDSKPGMSTWSNGADSAIV
jgi:hypothetical protein